MMFDHYQKRNRTRALRPWAALPLIGWLALLLQGFCGNLVYADTGSCCSNAIVNEHLERSSLGLGWHTHTYLQECVAECLVTHPMSNSGIDQGLVSSSPQVDEPAPLFLSVLDWNQNPGSESTPSFSYHPLPTSAVYLSTRRLRL